MTIDDIKSALENVLNPSYLKINDDSENHSGHYSDYKSDISSHISGVVVSESFSDIKPLERQRMLNNILKQFMSNGLHAYSIKTLTLDEFKNKK